MRLSSALAFACFFAAPAAAQDFDRGRTLYQTYCGDCHYERVHQRPRERSRVETLSDLRDMVARWAPQTKHRFTLDEQEDVVTYLNESHYRFGLSPRRTTPASPTK
jgi:mono/diheme cytochrome c family protein